MKPENNSPPPVYLLLRVLCGGYLVYTAWELRDAARGSGVFLAAALSFLVVGIALAGSSLWTLARHPYFRSREERETRNEDTEHD